MSSLRWYVSAATVLAAGACATAEPPPQLVGTDASRIDARVTDGSVTDGSVVDARPIDARPVDARVVDAPPGCTTMILQLLNNPAFDANPVGTGWTETLIDPMYPLITPDDGVPEHTAPNKAWLGGFETGTDELRQDVVVPVGTTALVLRGQVDIRTDEFLGGPFDIATVALTTTGGAVLETVLNVSDVDATTSWTPFQRIFGQPYAGQTVRVRVRSTNDGSYATSFYFDSLALEATVCQ
jgi:hypothetical protein